jgi:hypothetical protein
MADNRYRKYLVVAEVERTGFVVDYCRKYWSAVKLADELLLLGELFTWGESERIETQLRSRNIKEYEIKGNLLYFDKSIYGSTDGKYSVAVLQINKNDFTIESFIRERENHSTVFSTEIHWDKKEAEYFDNFPLSNHISN